MGMPKVHVKKGDTVVVLSGREGLRGMRGRVKAVYPRQGLVVVEGLNLRKKAVRPDAKNPQGGFIEQEGPLPASKVQPICPSCDKPTRIRKKWTPEGDKIRICVHCGASLDGE
jgi:large subunit ribosomal protein L24